MRSDARKNRDRLLDATIEAILDVGREPARDTIAARAGLGIGTLYRHFPDRDSLLHAAARRALERSIDAGEASLAHSADSLDTLRMYLHAAVENGIGVVNIIQPLLGRTGWPDLAVRAEQLLTTIVERGKNDHHLRADITERDIVYAAIRFGRPLALGLTLAEERAIAHRQLDAFIEGLRARPETRDVGNTAWRL